MQNWGQVLKYKQFFDRIVLWRDDFESNILKHFITSLFVRQEVIFQDLTLFSFSVLFLKSLPCRPPKVHRLS